MHVRPDVNEPPRSPQKLYLFAPQVFEYDLLRQLTPHMKDVVPLPGIYYPDFIAANQSDRADNILPGSDKQVRREAGERFDC